MSNFIVQKQTNCTFLMCPATITWTCKTKEAFSWINPCSPNLFSVLTTQNSLRLLLQRPPRVQFYCEPGWKRIIIVLEKKQHSDNYDIQHSVLQSREVTR